MIDADHHLTRDNFVEYSGMRLELLDILVTQLEIFMPPPSMWPFVREGPLSEGCCCCFVLFGK